MRVIVVFILLFGSLVTGSAVVYEHRGFLDDSTWDCCTRPARGSRNACAGSQEQSHRSQRQRAHDEQVDEEGGDRGDPDRPEFTNTDRQPQSDERD